MELTLINGIYPKQDAVNIVTDIFSIKIDYHKKRIASGSLSPDELIHSQKRIEQLQTNLEQLLQKIQAHKEPQLNIEAHIDLNIFAPVTQ